MNHTTFPPGFLWGAATSAYQIEGATCADGRGVSIWDTFCAVPGKVFGGHSGEPACQHYFKYAEDVGIMRDLGLGSYRFSLAWPRLMPDGRGKLFSKALDFYRRLIDLLLESGIRPMATLYHWDLPQTLQDKGGWANSDTPKRFADYCFAVFGELADVVPLWITINEPAVTAVLGHVTGEMAPGLRKCGQSAKRRTSLGLTTTPGIEWHGIPPIACSMPQQLPRVCRSPPWDGKCTLRGCSRCSSG